MRTPRPRTLHVLMALFANACLWAQTPLQPAWMHTWPFGQHASAMWHQPTAGDNHVAVDPVTGLVYCTISDVNALTSWQNELLYTFDAQGNDLTPAAVPVLTTATYTSSEDLPANPHSSNDIAIWDGRLVASHLLFVPPAGWSDLFSFGDANGTRRNVVPGIGSPVPQRTGRVAVDATHALLLDDTDGLGGRHLFCMTNDGWPVWMADCPAFIHDVAVHQDVAYACTGTAIERRSMTDGGSMPSLPTNGHAQRMVLQGTGIHYAGHPMADPGTLHVARCALDGTPQWSTPVPLGDDLWLTGIVVDQAGRTWVSATLIDPIDQMELGGRLACLGTDGTLLNTYTYGASMNGIATDGTHLFITGWSSTVGTETYLIGFGADVVTAASTPLPAQRPLLWPQPTDAILHVVSSSPARSLHLMDATGRVVRQWSTGGAQRVPLDVGDMPSGTYVLRTIAWDGSAEHVPVIIER